MKRALAWLVGITMVALAAVVGEVTLTDGQQQAPFAVDAAVGERAEGRTLAVTVRQVRVTEQVSDGRGWTASGRWVVVDLDAEARETETGALLALAQLDLGDRRISASERPESIASASLHLGLAQSGSLAFELPDGATGPAVLRIGRSAEDRLDSVVELAIDLDALEQVAEIDLEETRWAG